MGVGPRSSSGQMTVEFVIAFPVALIIALACVNAVLFFSECASFDRLFRQMVCIYAASPAYEQDTDNTCSLIGAALEDEINAEHIQCSVTSNGADGRIVSFAGTLKFQPTLFGMGPLTGAFGVSFPPLSHTAELSVDMYKSGVVL
ncbi:MAG: hypothetical protein ACLU06_07565 [Eggerthellaceae bacterium]